ILARVAQLDRHTLVLTPPALMRALVELEVIPFEFLKPHLERIKAARLAAQCSGVESGQKRLAFGLRRRDWLARRLGISRDPRSQRCRSQVLAHLAPPRERRGRYRQR